ncbi:Pimeloyl-ACP methyl ester carboxylesterase [Actinacidiphila yanglinensis]|uniref:Pimeloyl-ACP methyl ester carboxylesterase n=1 Tax=Actinacidiphila yanglinensis TaxID=310779 RepID=A0A1H6CXH9_9ACTN|nr:alpha/beta hydrolase [Actinacidiphila yanglinensis]SEG77453.1 Pimeloyl-ACP methyl ester carboxylesterase [Actinacidiphila yanglinensis]
MQYPSNEQEPGRVDVPQGTIAYRVAGPAGNRCPPVVFVHGLLVDNRLWTTVADRLAERGIRSYAPDWPLGSHHIPMAAGADLSPRGMADVINGFLAARGLDDVTLVGSDTGGGLCQFAIDTDHRRIGRLVLTNCDAFELFPPPGFRMAVEMGRSPLLLWMMMRALTLTRVRQGNRGYGPVFSGRPDAGVTRRWIDPALNDGRIRRDLAKVMAAVRPADLVDVSSRFGEFTKPVHLVWGDDDAFFPLEVAERLQGAFPNSTLVIIPGGRTFVPMDYPDEVAEVVARAGGLAS